MGSDTDHEDLLRKGASVSEATTPTAEDEVVDLCRDLIRIDTSNYGDGSGPGERRAAEYVAGQLAEVGLEPTLLESEPGRASVIARWPGEDPTRDALLVHGHLDVVPADASDWKVDPFAGEVADGCVWGRGAVDMKDMDAMVLAVVREWRRQGRRPPRDVVLAFLADEEAGGTKGSHWLAANHPGLFEGCTESISEVGGFSFTVPDGTRVYLLQTAQKGIAWLRLVAKGTAGHGSMVNTDNAVTELAEAVARIGRHEWPVRLTPTVRTFLDEMSDALGVPLDHDHPKALLVHLGTLARIVGATLRNTTNPSRLNAGYKTNVIPQTATAEVDGRFLPGFEDEFLATIDELLGPKVRREVVHRDIALETTFDGALVDAMVGALKAEDPSCRVVPYCLSGGTDDKAFSQLGIRGFGFAPLQLPPDLDFSGMFHGVDERVPVESLRFGVRVLDRFLATS
ncbi:MAG: M20/M25/M40 family metallo-hydrolase [Actinomycetota bacterium]|nr:M20/M25/M40 family metallo-hydrolase [Actinomycetota bacterium]